MEMLLGWGEAMRRNEMARDFFIVPLLIRAGQFLFVPANGQTYFFTQTTAVLSAGQQQERGESEIKLPLKTIHWINF